MAKKKAPYEGRTRGQKNLIREGNTITNQFGVQITEDEFKRLQSAVRRVNYRRKKMEEHYRDRPLFEGRIPLPESREQIRMMGEEMDAMIRKRSTSLNQFQSRGDFMQYLKRAERATSIDYMAEMGRLYKRNLKQAIETNFGAFPELVAKINMKLQMMPQDQFQALTASNRLFQIKYVYSTDKQLEQLNRMMDFLGIKNPYEDFEDPYEDFELN